MNSKRENPLDRLPGSNEWNIDRTGKAAIGKAGQGGRNLAPTHGKVRLAGDRERIQGRMWDGAVGERGGSGHQMGDTCYKPNMGTALLGGGLGVSTH